MKTSVKTRLNNLFKYCCFLHVNNFHLRKKFKLAAKTLIGLTICSVTFILMHL